MKETLQKLRQLRDSQPRPHPFTGQRITYYLKCLERDDLDFYYKYHKPGSHQIFNEEII